MGGSIVALLSVVASPACGWAQERPWEWGMHPMWGMWGFWGVWGLVMMVIMVVFWALVIAGLVLGLRWLVGQGRAPSDDRALQVLRERYARGEISKEEFEAKKRDLS
jgi:putative membrane protein